MDIEKIYDIIALRVIVCTIEECYTVLGIIHSILCDVARMIAPPAVLAVNLKDMDLNLRDEFKKNWEEIIQAQIDKFWDPIIESKPIIAETIPEEYSNNPETARNQDVRDRSKN